MRNAWESALQAVLSAISKVVNISSRDIDGLIMKRENDYRFVLYDNSASGNGALLGLMPSADEGRNTIAVETTRAVLKTAIKICEECPNCGHKLDEANRDKKPGTPQECHCSPEQYRPRQACYHCIMRYENQNKHSKLDVHDAAVILKAMLGPNASGIDDDGPSNHNGATGGERNSKADATTGADNAGDRSETEQGRGAASSNEAIHFPVGKPVLEGAPQRFISIETNKSLCKKLKTKRNEYFYVFVNGEVIKDKLTSVLQGKRAVFEKSGVVSYSNIMEIK